MSHDKNTKELLEQLLSGLYSQQVAESAPTRDCYLKSADGQYLGRITKNRYDTNSLLNQYGPYGSKYSQTCIFNPYSPYGSKYGQFSVNNPYCSTPPKLFIKGQFLGHISKNRYVSHQIPTDAFLYTLQNDIDSLLVGRIIESESHARQLWKESFIEAHDETFLGNLKPDAFDNESVFNTFGPYGSQFSQISIFNSFCPYGGQFAQQSPFNQFTNTPPKVYLNGVFVAYLTVNTMITPRVDPNNLKQWAQANVSTY